ncbi:MAG TPA: ankyrin repeat domain-containing protein [Chthonomonadaceae bacterium]|nr:ankyrin repeat domain-containing protein [Chthonomonadaceae bacterium]
MKRRQRGWIRLAALLATVALVSALCLWMRREQRRYELGRALISALVRHDVHEARELVLQGADPNTRYIADPPQTLATLWNRIIRRVPPPRNDSPTALLIACGAPWVEEPQNPHDQPGYFTYAPLVEAMLAHGARVRVVAAHGYTSLHFACFVTNGDAAIVHALLTHGANPNAQTDQSDTPLYLAICANREYGTFVDLLDHGADPNILTSDMDCALSMARGRELPGVVDLLLQHGARPRPPDPPTRVPAIARLLGVRVGWNGQGRLIRRFGDGTHSLGGHSGGTVTWHTVAPPGYIASEGFNYNGEGEVLENLDWDSGPAVDHGTPTARRLRPRSGWLGTVDLGMTIAQVRQLTAGVLPPPAIAGPVWTWRAHGFVRPNARQYDVYTTWTAELTFSAGRLGGIHLACDGGQRAPPEHLK